MKKVEFSALAADDVVYHIHLGVCNVVGFSEANGVSLVPQDPLICIKYGGLSNEDPLVENRKKMIEGYVQVCQTCGCSEMNPCILPGKPNCYWHDEKTCSHCVDFPGKAKRHFEIMAEKYAPGVLVRKNHYVLPKGVFPDISGVLPGGGVTIIKREQ